MVPLFCSVFVGSTVVDIWVGAGVTLAVTVGTTVTVAATVGVGIGAGVGSISGSLKMISNSCSCPSACGNTSLILLLFYCLFVLSNTMISRNSFQNVHLTK